MIAGYRFDGIRNAKLRISLLANNIVWYEIDPFKYENIKYKNM